MIWIINALAVFSLAVFLAGIMIPQILLISFRKKLFDVPDERKIHHLPVPRLGGIAFIPVILFSIGFVLGVNILFGHFELFSAMLNNALPMTFCFCSALVLYIMGMADDLVGVRYRAKFVGQTICAIMLMAGGLQIDNFHGVLWLTNIWEPLAWAISILAVVFIVNAINLIDGIDGLASGLSSAAVIIYAVAFYMAGEYMYMMLAMATLGVLVPFFFFNVFGDPNKRKKIFMGDTGSLTIGLILSILCFKMIKTVPTEGMRGINPLIVAVSPLIIPCFDVIRVYFYRLRHGQDPFLPDQNHIHHKLLALGLKPRIAMITIVSLAIIFTVVNMLMSIYINVNFILLLDAAVFTFGMMILPRHIKRRLNRQ